MCAHEHIMRSVLGVAQSVSFHCFGTHQCSKAKLCQLQESFLDDLKSLAEI